MYVLYMYEDMHVRINIEKVCSVADEGTSRSACFGLRMTPYAANSNTDDARIQRVPTHLHLKSM